MAARTHGLLLKLNNALSSRLLTKTLTWRSIGIATLFIISLAMTGSPMVSGMLALVYHVVNTLLYYFHEKAWEGQGSSLRSLMASVAVFTVLTLTLAWLASLSP